MDGGPTVRRILGIPRAMISPLLLTTVYLIGMAYVVFTFRGELAEKPALEAAAAAELEAARAALVLDQEALEVVRRDERDAAALVAACGAEVAP